MSSKNSKTILKKGSWTKEETKLFIEAVQLFGKNWMKLSNVVKTRSSIQIRSHTQKLILSICKKLKMNSSTIKECSIENYYNNNLRCKYLLDQSELMILEIFKGYIPWHKLLLLKAKKKTKKRKRYEVEELLTDNVISFEITNLSSSKTKGPILNIYERCLNSYLEIIQNIENIERLLKNNQYE